jgi:hypothetical protein
MLVQCERRLTQDRQLAIDPSWVPIFLLVQLGIGQQVIHTGKFRHAGLFYLTPLVRK